MATNVPHNPERKMAEMMPKWGNAALARPLYRVKDWGTLFESAETRKYARLHFVRLPNGHQGKGWARLCRQPAPMELFAAFVLICELASRGPARGYLADEDGPWTAEDMGDMTRMPGVEPFARALQELVIAPIDWLEVVRAEEIAALKLSGEFGMEAEESPGELRFPGDAGRLPGESPGKRRADRRPPGESPSYEAPTGRARENLPPSPANADLPGESAARIGSVRNGSTPPIVPQGGQSASGAAFSSNPPASGPAASAEKKEEGAAPGSAEAVDETVRAICALFGRGSGKLQESGMYALRGIAAALPLPAEAWVNLKAMREARQSAAKNEQGDPEDFNLRVKWLKNAEALAENLLPAAETAEGWCRDHGVGAGARTLEKKEKGGAEPEGWAEWLRGAYRLSEVPRSFFDLDSGIQAEFFSAKKEGGVA